MMYKQVVGSLVFVCLFACVHSALACWFGIEIPPALTFAPISLLRAVLGVDLFPFQMQGLDCEVSLSSSLFHV